MFKLLCVWIMLAGMLFSIPVLAAEPNCDQLFQEAQEARKKGDEAAFTTSSSTHYLEALVVLHMYQVCEERRKEREANRIRPYEDRSSSPARSQ